MDQTLYDLCFSGASSSNLGMGYRNLYEEIVTGWMSDDDASNIDRVGHRRWCLNPAMQYTGFGIDGRYYAMYVFDESLGDRGYSKVAWPAQNMPLELFSGEMPWSLSIGSQIDAGSVSVTLKRINDGRTWNFSAGSSAGNFYINNENYGQKGCIIFRPLGIEGYRDGDQFEVTVTGTDLSVSYTVKFFWIHEHAGGTATCQRQAVCSKCGTPYGELGPHSFSTDWTIDIPAACTAKGSRSHHCSVPGCSEKQDVEEIKKLSHEWSKYQIVREPTALKKGEKVRTCSLCGKTQTTVVEANPPKTAAKAIKKVPSRITLKPGQIYRLKPRLLPSDSDYKLTYRSSNKKVAAVGLKGRIKAKRKGKAVITVRSGKIKVKCKVKVR